MLNTQFSHEVNKSKGIISFIIPCYNVPIHMVKECIESIYSLFLKPDEREIIIVDDGSDVAFIEQLTEYAQDIIYIRQRNSGTSVARNIGINICKGDYIQFIDADDKLIKIPYEYCINIMRKNKADIVAFHATSKDRIAHEFYTKTPIDGSSYMRNNNIKGSICCYLIERKTLGELRFRANTYHEDEEFTPQLLLRAEKVYDTDANAYYYRKRPESRMNAQGLTNTMQRLSDNEQVIEHIYKMASTGSQRDREALQRRAAQLTMDYIYNIIIETRSYDYLEQCVERLYQKGLFPLPNKKYTTKYHWFRIASKSKYGRKFLCHFLPKV